MTLRRHHTLLFLVLALFYVAERALPCADDCLPKGSESPSCEQILHAGDAHDDGDDDAHHCDHCSCACHVPAVGSEHYQSTALFDVALIGSPYLVSVPTALVNPPDHIPLI